jgi:hypothetical protein
MRMNGRKDLTNLIVTFDNFAKAVKNSAIYLQSLSDACDSLQIHPLSVKF